MTRQRQLIYDIVAARPSHLTAEEIFLLAREYMPSVARGTVYRNLGVLARNGLIRRLEMSDAPARYDREGCAHPHLICRSCGLVTDLSMPKGFLDPLTEKVDGPVQDYDLRLYYTCPVCRTEKAEH